jgi:UDPglucose 6-dehydrogenase
MAQARPLLETVTYCANAYDCADSADALVIATEWEQFRALDLPRLRDLMACPVVIDLRNIYRPEDMQVRGFAYACVGRALPLPTFANAAFDQFLSEAQIKSPGLSSTPRAQASLGK